MPIQITAFLLSGINPAFRLHAHSSADRALWNIVKTSQTLTHYAESLTASVEDCGVRLCAVVQLEEAFFQARNVESSIKPWVCTLINHLYPRTVEKC